MLKKYIFLACTWQPIRFYLAPVSYLINQIWLLHFINNFQNKRGMEQVKNMFSMEVAKTLVKTENSNRKMMILIVGIVFGLFAFIMEGLWFARLQSAMIW